MKKLLFMIDTLNGGGAEKVLFDILNNFDYKKYEVDLFLIKKEGIYLEKLDKRVKIRSFFDKNDNFLKYFFDRKLYKLARKYPKLINLIIKDEYDVSIAFLEGRATKILSYKNGKKIAWVHIDLEKHRVLNFEEEKKYYSCYDRIVGVSNQATNAIKKLYPEISNKCLTIYNPIIVEDILIKAQRKEKVFNDNSKIKIVSVGRLARQKGFDILLEAHKKLIDEKIEHEVYILGNDGGEKEYLIKKIKEYNLENSFFLIGFKENPYSYIKQADIFVSVSRYEGYSLVIAEAICLEKPIISTKCVGPNELLDNGKYGIMIEPENVEELSNAIKNLILNSELRKKYETLSLERRKIFNKKEVFEQIENLIDNLCIEDKKS